MKNDLREDRDRFEARLRERLKTYVGLPNIVVVRQSIAEEIIEEVESDGTSSS